MAKKQQQEQQQTTPAAAAVPPAAAPVVATKDLVIDGKPFPNGSTLPPGERAENSVRIGSGVRRDDAPGAGGQASPAEA